MYILYGKQHVLESYKSAESEKYGMVSSDILLALSVSITF